MEFDDEIPIDDHVAAMARNSLQQLGKHEAPTWDRVTRRVSHLRRVRIAVVVATVLLPLVSAAAIASASTRHSARVDVATPPESATSSSSTSSSTTTTPTTNAITMPSLDPGHTNGVLGPGQSTSPESTSPGPTQITADLAPLDPTAATFTYQLRVEEATIAVCETTDVQVTVRNIGDRPSNTNGYGSVALACGGRESDARFAPPRVLQVGESLTFSLSFTATAEDVGTVGCGAGIALHGDAWSVSDDDITFRVSGPTPTTG